MHTKEGLILQLWFQHSLSETSKDLCDLNLCWEICRFLVLCNLEKIPKILTFILIGPHSNLFTVM